MPTEKTSLQQAAELERKVLKLTEKRKARRDALVEKQNGALADFDQNTEFAIEQVAKEYPEEVRSLAGVE
jgi:hypothetical protein